MEVYLIFFIFHQLSTTRLYIETSNDLMYHVISSLYRFIRQSSLAGHLREEPMYLSELGHGVVGG